MTAKHPRTPRGRAHAGRIRFAVLLSGVAVVAACVALRCYWDAEPASAEAPRRSVKRPASRLAIPTAAKPVRSAAATSQPAPSGPRIVATVNGDEITRDELGRECLKHYGAQVLEHLVNKYLIKQECRQRNITVTQAEVNAEIERMATRFGLAVAQWLKMLEEERGISPRQYANDIIWPTLALRKLAGDRLEVTEAELAEQYESQYGPSVQARLIVCNDRAVAKRLRAQAAADPTAFAKLAKAESVDVTSASMGGMIQPIRKHTGNEEIERVAFTMKENEISPVIQVGDQYVIIKCEGQLPARRVAFEQVKMGLVETIRQSKLRGVSDEIFQQLQEKAQVQNVLNNPTLRHQMPGVAALINGQRVNDRELAELCIDRHGKEVLEGTINLRLLQQACRRQKVTVTDQEVDEEIRQAAARLLKPKEDGSPDVETWLQMVTEEQEVSLDVYRTTSVWPTVALKKLVGDQVEVTQKDLQRGYEANFGPRVRCLAIVVDNLRHAQQVWDKARKNPTPEFFGDLAEEYSVEPSSRSLRGEVPPLQKHGGQPVLEKVAFSLAPGELSSIVQTGRELYVILLCLGRTEPIRVEFAEVRDEIYKDLHDKKQRAAMAQYFQKLQDSATIDNFLAGTSRSPKKVQQTGHTIPVR